MSITIDAFLNEVFPLKGCPRQVALNAILDSIRELCDQADVWKETLPAINVVASTASYALAPGNGKQVKTPIEARHNGTPLYLATESQLDYYNPYWRTADPGTPSNYLIMDEGTITLYPTPDTSITNGLIVRASIMPTVTIAGDYVVDPTGTKIVNAPDYLTPDDITTIFPGVLLQHKETVVAGAKSRLLFIPDKPWTDLKLAAYFKGVAKAGISRASATANLGNVRTTLKVRIPFFA